MTKPGPRSVNVVVEVKGVRGSRSVGTELKTRDPYQCAKALLYRHGDDYKQARFHAQQKIDSSDLDSETRAHWVQVKGLLTRWMRGKRDGDKRRF